MGDSFFVAPSAPTDDHSILRTKLHRPPVTEDMVCRNRLHELMDASLQTPLTLVSAGAGYGKSVLVSSWIESRAQPCAWLSLDTADSDVAGFLSYAVAAIQKLFPNACTRTGALITAPTLPPIPVLGRTLVNELHDIDTPFVLVLDDYHRIAPASDVHDLLDDVMTHPPADLHLVIITRRDPPLPLAALRASGRLTEVRLRDIQFSRSDTAAFLDKTAGLSLSEETLTNLMTHTEGWVVGLRLVALQLHHIDDPEVFLKNLHGGIQHQQDYLVEEVLARRSPRMRDWLLRASILNRFCPELCEAVCSDDDTDRASDLDGRLFIDELRRLNLFTIPLDADGRWFRYHHLLRELLLDLLKREKDPKEVAALHARAGAWCAEHGLIDEALGYALKGGDVQAAIQLVEEHRHELLNTERWNLLKRWIGLLPQDAVAESPALVSTQACLHDYSGQVSDTIACLDRAETLLSTLPPEDPTRESVEGEIATLRAVYTFVAGEGPRTLELAERALELLPPEATQIRSLAFGFRALAHQSMGDLAGALRGMDESLAGLSSDREILKVRLTLYLCLIHVMSGSADKLEKSAQRAIALQEGTGLRSSMGAARFFLGVSHYLHNELPEAERELAGMLEDRYSVRTYLAVNGAVVLACIYQALGRTDEATRVVESALVHTSERGDLTAGGTCRAFEVDLAVRQGRIADARRLSRIAEFDSFPPIYFYYIPQLTPVKLLLAEKTPTSLADAGEQLDHLEEFLRRTHRINGLIEVLALQALALDAGGNEPAALDKLKEALALAEPGGVIRSFIDLGAPMADLLRRLIRQGTEQVFCRNLLEAFGSEQVGATAGAQLAAAAGERPGQTPFDFDSFTNRELDILELLAQRLQNKEIAASLSISTHTVGSHLKRIYQKLDVHGRRQAIQRAIESGLIDRRPPG